MPALTDPARWMFAPGVLAAGALLQILIAPIASSRAKGIVAMLCSLPSVLAVLMLVPAVHAGNSFHSVLCPWDGPLCLVVHVDGLSVLFALMGTMLGAIVLLYSIGYMARDAAATRFYATMLVFIGGFVALVFSANLLVLYLCWEVIGLCSFSLVGFWYKQREAVEGARKVLLMTHIASYGLLAAVLVLYHRAGTAVWTDAQIPRNFSTGVFVLMLLAILAKSVQVPLHTWIPDAMAAPTPVSSLLHAASYVTAGVYLAARMHSFAPWHPAWSTMLITVATVTMAVGVMYALVQTDLKRMLAFSTVSQIGYMLLGVAIGTPLGITAGLLHCLNHGFFKGGLFLNAGAVQHATGTRDMNRLGGLAPAMPHTTLCWLVGVANMAGIPLMSGFVSKWMLYAAALQAGWAIPAAVAWMASLGTVFLCAKATSAVFLGPPTECTAHAHEVSRTMRWGMGMMALGGIVLGVAPQFAVMLIFNPLLGAFGMSPSVSVTWLGIFAGAGNFSTIGGLVLAIVSFVLGGAIFMLARGARAAQAYAVSGSGAVMMAGGDVFTGGEPLWEENRLTAHDFSQIFEQNWRTFFRWSDIDRIYLWIWRNLQLYARLFARPFTWMEHNALRLLFALTAAVLGSAALMRQSFVMPPAAASSAIPPILAVACCSAGLLLILAAVVRSETESLGLPAAITLAFVMGGCTVHAQLLRLGLLEAAALVTVVAVWQHARTHSARVVYLTVVLLSGACLGASELLRHETDERWSRALLLTGICLKFAAVPFLFWLLRLADELPVLLLGLILAVVDMAAMGELWLRSQLDPALMTPQALWVAFGVLTSLAAAVLMVTQHSLKRLLVLSSIEDSGFLVFGLCATDRLGTTGVIWAAAAHAVAKALLFICLAGPELDGRTELRHAALASRYPYSAFGFLIGMLAVVGVPPTLGFIGRWRLYEAALTLHPLLLLVLLAASVLALLAYVRAFTITWWGPPPEETGIIHADRRVLSATAAEPLGVRLCIVLLSATLLVSGFAPSALEQLVSGGRP